jgi:RHS repeat-associated protein
VISNSAQNFLNNRPPPNAGVPKAYLNYVFLDDQFQYAKGYAVPITSASATGAQTLAPPTMPVMAPKNGFVYIYVSNESDYNVYFDNLQVSLTHGPIAEDNAYYPFGLTMGGISDKAVKWNLPENKIRFAGKELQNREFSDGTGLDAYDFGPRMYDPQIGRWLQQDPLSEYMRRWTPYAYGFNNPLRFTDATGMDPEDELGKKPKPPAPPPPGDEPTGNMAQWQNLYPATVTGHKPKGWGHYLWDALDYVPFVGSIKQIGEGIYHGSWKEATMGVVMLGVDVFTAGEGGEGIRVAEKGVQILAEDEAKEVAEKAVVENAEKEATEMTASELKEARRKAVEEAWKDEKNMVEKTGEGTHNWTAKQKEQLLKEGKVKGYEGHHINSVKGSPHQAGNPNNIKFMTRVQHFKAHGGNWRNPTTGTLLNRKI